MRFDLQIIASWIEPGSRVVDLGCGEGELLKHLIEHKKVVGSGIEHNEDKVARCIEKGLSVLQGDINEEILDYPDDSFDYVILSQTLQQVYAPDNLIGSMMRRAPANDLHGLRSDHPAAAISMVRHSQHPGDHAQRFSKICS